MNLKSIQRNYEHLTMLERLSLLDNAIARDDESEIRAVVAASPRKSYSEPDYVDLFEKITKVRFNNLLVRLGFAMNFDFLLRLDPGDDERISDDAKLAAYLYVRATDAWKAVSDELCLRPDYDKEISEIFFAVELLIVKDRLLREFAFTDAEAKDYLDRTSGISKIQTLANEINAIREALGLPSK